MSRSTHRHCPTGVDRRRHRHRMALPARDAEDQDHRASVSDDHRSVEETHQPGDVVVAPVPAAAHGPGHRSAAHRTNRNQPLGRVPRHHAIVAAPSVLGLRPIGVESCPTRRLKQALTRGCKLGGSAASSRQEDLTATCLVMIRGMGSGERVRWAHGSEGIELLEAAFDTFTYDRHTHDTYAIGVTLHGVQRFSCRSATHDSTPGDVMVINPGEVHDGRSGTAGGYMYRMFYVRPDILGAAVEDVAPRPSDVGARCPVFSDRDLFCQLDLAWRTMAAAPASLAADELLHRSLGMLGARVVQPTGRASATGDDRVLRWVRDYLQDHVEQDVTLYELSAIAGMSRFQLTRRFKTR